MARDEALMTLVGTSKSPPTLRLYQWDRPTISLGYFQHYADYETLPPPAGGLPVVRRLTGGGAILHDLELTYSLALHTGHPLLSNGPGGLYELAHDALIETLATLGQPAVRCGSSDDSGAARGPFFCFERRHAFDVLVGGDKIAGSAQRRTRAAVLQHGSIILANRFGQQPSGAVDRTYEESIRILPSAMVDAFARISGARCVSGGWSKEELSAAAALREKYAGETWTRRL